MNLEVRSRAAVLAWLALCACLSARADSMMCGGGQDMMVQALERVTPTSSNSDYQDALELLKHAVSSCAELGDAWYYRSLVEQRLGQSRQAAFSLMMAKQFGSEAMNEGQNPFVLATPIASRALAGSNPQQPAPPSSSGTATAGPVQQKWALVVGISHFQDPLIPTLKYTTDDARSFAEELVDPKIGRFPPDHVNLLTDAQATTVNIRAALNNIARHAQPSDEVVIYVATHGSPRSMDVIGANYIVTYDTKFETNGKVDEDALYATALPMVQLANAVATRVKALRTAVILDTCFSGGAITNPSSEMAAGIGNASVSGKTMQRMAEGTGRIILAAASEKEESLESSKLHHGYFTYFLLQALPKNSGLDPLSDVYTAVAQAVTRQVAADAAADHAKLAQHPVMSRSSSQADFALGIPPGNPATAPAAGGR